MNIVQKPDPVLRKRAEEIPLLEISSKETLSLINAMKKSLFEQEDGIAIAAPQIGESKRVFVVSHKVFQSYDSNRKPLDPVLTTKDDKVFINPTITKLSKKKVRLEEGCLSVRWKYGFVHRSRQAFIEAYDENGRLFKMGASGLLAQIFQHEVDHLDGVLFIDKAEDLHDITPNS